LLHTTLAAIDRLLIGCPRFEARTGGETQKEHLNAYVKALADGAGPMKALPVLTGMTNTELDLAVADKLAAGIKFRAE